MDQKDQKINGSQALWRSLEAEGVHTVFGYPGGQIMPVYDALSTYSGDIRHILVRQTLDPDKTYYLRLKSVLDNSRTEMYMDYLEWCAKEIYDNPNEPEDIW